MALCPDWTRNADSEKTQVKRIHLKRFPESQVARWIHIHELPIYSFDCNTWTGLIIPAETTLTNQLLSVSIKAVCDYHSHWWSVHSWFIRAHLKCKHEVLCYSEVTELLCVHSCKYEESMFFLTCTWQGQWCFFDQYCMTNNWILHENSEHGKILLNCIRIVWIDVMRWEYLHILYNVSKPSPIL